jgi:predicted nucleotidyltransferase
MLTDMLTQEQIRLLGALARLPATQQSLSGLKRAAHERSHSKLQLAIKAFLKHDLVREERVGRTKLLPLHYAHASTYLELDAADRLTHVARDLRIIQEHLDRAVPVYALIVFGSHATAQHSKQSDLDVFVMTMNDADEHDAKSALRSAANKTIRALDVHTSTVNGLRDMLEAPYKTLAHEIRDHHLVVCGARSFYNVIQQDSGRGRTDNTLPRTR